LIRNLILALAAFTASTASAFAGGAVMAPEIDGAASVSAIALLVAMGLAAYDRLKG
jgi:hypothetical protein